VYYFIQYIFYNFDFGIKSESDWISQDSYVLLIGDYNLDCIWRKFA